MSPPPSAPAAAPAARTWRSVVAPYQRPDLRRSVWQVINSFGPYLLLLGAMYWSLSVSYWLTLALAVPAAGFLVRIFIILHDCGHGSFFRSKRAGEIVGSICGVLTFTPFHQWRHDHAMHHATTGDLDRRGFGDVMTITVGEYEGKSRWQRFQYMVFRHPLVLLLVGPIYTFLVTQRFVLPASGPRERRSVYATNTAILAIIVLCSLTIGLKAYLLIQFPVVMLAGFLAIWLFYCQHQFEETYWARHDEWDFESAALKGSSYFKLPRLLQWFTGNIGFHHVHHLNPRVPNYNLEQCHNADPRFQEVTTLTIRSSLSAFTLKLWDEQSQRLVNLGEVEARLRERERVGRTRA